MKNLIDDITQAVTQNLPEGLGEVTADMKSLVQAKISSALAAQGLVTRHEFDIQCKVLAKTREKLKTLEAQLATLEKQLNANCADRSESSLEHDLAD